MLAVQYTRNGGWLVLDGVGESGHEKLLKNVQVARSTVKVDEEYHFDTQKIMVH